MSGGRAPVLAGVGAVTEGDAEAAELMAAAARAAALDATGAGAAARRLLAAVDAVAVPQGTWSYPDPGRLVAARVGAPGARTTLAQIGVPQQTLVTTALRALAEGRAEVALVVGGEARAWARRAGEAALETAQPGAVPDVTETREPEFMARPEADAGLVVPVRQYAMIENALRHHEGRSIADHQRAVADLWARCSAVAAANPRAAFGTERTPAEIMGGGGGNYPLAFPYRKWHASQWTVDQAAALLLCTADAGRRLGVAPERCVHPLVGLDANHAVSLSRRADLHRWPAMEVLGRAAEAHLGRPLRDLEVVDVYSCFPVAVEVQQRALHLDPETAPTVTGGMAFAGGPFNNYTYQATCAVVDRLRADPGAVGMVTTVCGLLTKPGLAVWSATPGAGPPLLADLAAEAQAATPTRPVRAEHHGAGRVATYTVTYDGTDDAGRPTTTIVIADVADGGGAPGRCVAVSTDPSLAAEAVAHELIGAEVRVEGATFSV